MCFRDDLVHDVEKVVAILAADKVSRDVAVSPLEDLLQTPQFEDVVDPEADEHKGGEDADPVHEIGEVAKVHPAAANATQLSPVLEHLDALLHKELGDEDEPTGINQVAPNVVVWVDVEAHRLHKLVEVAPLIHKEHDVGGGDEVLLCVVGGEAQLDFGSLRTEPCTVLELPQLLPHVRLRLPRAQVDGLSARLVHQRLGDGQALLQLRKQPIVPPAHALALAQRAEERAPPARCW
mmetsp:Transcript_13478/g.31669  ORF Transcript_13478/g.31669 Transcript_13478/m.31669 type:complete len:236 (-) Transcript_13478:1158-1865(-)